jgi:hypothetical protein
MSDTQVTRREARALDRALAGDNGRGDPDGLLATATQLRAMFDVEIPDAGRERTMFVSGVSTRRHHFNPLRVMVPAAAFLVLVALAYLGGRTALPGDSLYPVRKALGSVGLADSPIEEIDARTGEAASLLSKAERSLDSNPGTSLRLAVEALETLGPAIDLLDELEGDELETRTDVIDALEGRAVDVIGEATSAGEAEGGSDRSSGNGSSGSDSSGNSGNSGDDADRSGSNSGNGSGDRSDDDNSGPGGGNDSNSGPGSDGEDRSGSNSGSDSDDDNSGPGSGSGDDSSGPGGGGDDDDADPELPDVDEGLSGGGDDSNSGPGGGGDDDEKDEMELDAGDDELRR